MLTQSEDDGSLILLHHFQTEHQWEREGETAEHVGDEGEHHLHQGVVVLVVIWSGRRGGKGLVGGHFDDIDMLLKGNLGLKLSRN